MAEVKVSWSPNALEQIKEIAVYIARDSKYQSERVVKLILKDPKRLIEHPRIGKIVPELRDEHYRELSVFSYRVIYKFDGSQIYILAVVHGKRLFNPELLA